MGKAFKVFISILLTKLIELLHSSTLNSIRTKIVNKENICNPGCPQHCYIALASLELMILLAHPPEC